MKKKVLLIATFDTKGEEALYLKERIEAQGVSVLTMDTGILAPPSGHVDIDQTQVARRGGTPLREAMATGDKGKCVSNMMRGAEVITRELYHREAVSRGDQYRGGPGNRYCLCGHAGPAHRRPQADGLHRRLGASHLRPLCRHKRHYHDAFCRRHAGTEFSHQTYPGNAAGAICGMVKKLCRESG